MRKIILFMCIFGIVSIKCGNNEDDKKNLQQFKEVQESFIPDVIMKVYEKIDRIEYENFLMGFNSQMKEKSYDFNCISGCDRNDLEDLNFEKGIEIPFDEKNYYSKEDSSLIYSFSYLTDCEMKFAGDIERKGDSLFLFLIDFSIPPTRCYCKYSFQFTINNCENRFKNVYVRRIKKKT